MSAAELATFAVAARCGCRRDPKVHFRAVEAGIADLRERCGPLPSDLVLFTLRCRHCLQIVEITARMLRLDRREPLRETA